MQKLNDFQYGSRSRLYSRRRTIWFVIIGGYAGGAWGHRRAAAALYARLENCFYYNIISRVEEVEDK